MSAATIGVAIALSPLVLLLVALIVIGASTPDGRRGALFTFSFATLTMIPIIIGMAIAGNPAWVVGAWVTAGLDLAVAVIVAATVGVQRMRKQGDT